MDIEIAKKIQEALQSEFLTMVTLDEILTMKKISFKEEGKYDVYALQNGGDLFVARIVGPNNEHVLVKKVDWWE